MTPTPPESAVKPRRYALLGMILMVVAIGIFMVFRGNRAPLMTRVDFDQAKDLWKDARPANYDIRVKVTGMQPGTYEVTVTDGIATAATFDGHRLTRQRTFGTWSATGMFDTLSRDLETNDQHNYLLLRAEFHPTYGIPMKYERIEMRTGMHDALQWEVQEFTPRP